MPEPVPQILGSRNLQTVTSALYCTVSNVSGAHELIVILWYLCNTQPRHGRNCRNDDISKHERKGSHDFPFVKPITKNIPEIVSGKESAVLCSVTIGV